MNDHCTDKTVSLCVPINGRDALNGVRGEVNCLKGRKSTEVELPANHPSLNPYDIDAVYRALKENACLSCTYCRERD